MTYEYKPDDKFGYKDTLPEGHDEKIIKGSEFDDEFRKISNAFKVLDPDFDGDIEIDAIDGLQDALDGKADKSALEQEIQDRINGDQALQDQIDALDPDGDRKVDWTEIEGKPDEFPPEPHTHDQYLTDETDPVFSASPAASITEEMMADWSDHTDPYDDTQIKADLASETQARIKGDQALAQDITDLEAAVGGVAGQLAFGGSYDANAGVIVKSNLSEFVEGQPLPDYSTVEGKFVIVAVAGDTPEELGEADWLVAGESGWVAIKYGTAGSVAWENVVGAPDFLTDAQGSIDGDSKQYVRKNGEWTEATGDSPWEQNGNDIYYDAGNVGIGTDDPQHPLTTTVGNRRISFKAGDVINVAEMRAHNEDDTGLAYMQYSAYDHEFHTDAGEVLRIRRDGKVGIGTNDPAETLTVAGPILSNKANYASNQDQAYMIAAAKGYDGSTEHWGKHGYQHRLKSNSTGGSRITIDTHLGEMWSMGSEGRTTFAGNVGIGMTPLTRDAKEQLAEWSGWIEAKLELEPSLDRKAATLDVTDGAFEVLPTEDKLAEWMETRAAGDQLQVGGQGDISASGMIKALKPSEFGKPSDLWNISGWYGISNYGGLCTGGGYGVTLTSNGYRNSSDTWTSLNAAGKTGAAVIQLLPDGKIEFRQDADKADGSANTPNLRATFHADGGATFSGAVTADKTVITADGRIYCSDNGIGIAFSSDQYLKPVDSVGSYNPNASLGSQAEPWQILYAQNVFCENAAYFLNDVNVKEALTVDGDATVKGKVYVDTVFRSSHSGIAFGHNYWASVNSSGTEVTGAVDLGTASIKFGDGWFDGTVNSNFVRMSSGLAIGARDLIETLSTLRNATKDETTLEGLRDAIGNAVGGLIEKFEAMQSAATQEIDP